MKTHEMLTCRICGRKGLFLRTDEPVGGIFKVLCENGEGFSHVTKHGRHIIINLNDQEDAQAAIPFPQKLTLA